MSRRTLSQVSTDQLDTVERVAQFLETTRVAWASLVAASCFGAAAIGFYACMAIYPNTTMFEALGNISLTVLLLLTAIFSFRQERAQLRMALLVAGQRHSVSRAFVLDTVVKWRQNAKKFPISPVASGHDYSAERDIDIIEDEDAKEEAGYSWDFLWNKIMAYLNGEGGDRSIFAGREIHPSARNAPRLSEDASFERGQDLEQGEVEDGQLEPSQHRRFGRWTSFRS